VPARASALWQHRSEHCHRRSGRLDGLLDGRVGKLSDDRLDCRFDGIADGSGDLPDRRDSIAGGSPAGCMSRLLSTRACRRFVTATAGLLTTRSSRCQHPAHRSDPTYSLGGGIQHRGHWCNGATRSTTSRRWRRNPRLLIATRRAVRCSRRDHGVRVVPVNFPKPWVKRLAALRNCLGADQFRCDRRAFGGQVCTESLRIGCTQRHWGAVGRRHVVSRERAFTSVSGAGQHGPARQQGPGRNPAGPTDEDRPATGHPRSMSTVDHRDRCTQGGVDGCLPRTDPGDQSSGRGPGSRLPTPPRGHRASPAISSG